MTTKRIMGRRLRTSEFRLYPHGQLLNVLREQLRPYDKDDPREIPAPMLPGLPEPVSPAPTLPAPRPPAPGLPAPVLPAPTLPVPTPPAPSVPGLVPRPRVSEIVRDYPGAPWDVLQPLPWDPHAYPVTPAPPKLPLVARGQMRLTKAIKRAITDEPPPQLEGPKPIPPGRRLPGGTVPPERRLPASVSMVPPEDRAAFYDAFGLEVPSEDEIRDSLRDPRKIGLLGPTPAQMLDIYLDKAGIRYFSAREITKMWFRAPSGRRYKNIVKGASSWWFFYELLPPDIIPHGIHYVLAESVIPPPEMWPNMIPLLRVLDRFRHWLNAPVRIVGSYRLAHYNERIGGADKSFHMSFGALDFNFPRQLPNGELDVALFRRWFEATYRRQGDGVGAYPSFCHCDVGYQRHKLKGKSPDWTSRRRKNRVGLRQDATVA